MEATFGTFGNLQLSKKKNMQDLETQVSDGGG